MLVLCSVQETWHRLASALQSPAVNARGCSQQSTPGKTQARGVEICLRRPDQGELLQAMESPLPSRFLGTSPLQHHINPSAYRTCAGKHTAWL